jgi:HSP20 family protein
MAATAAQSRSPETERNIARRSENYPSREVFNFSAFPNAGPFTMLRRLTEEMDRAFASAFGLSRDAGEAGLWSPAIEVREREGNLEIIAELPGMKKDDVKVECTDQSVIIEGERRQEHEENQRGFRRSERSYGHFYRMVPMPQGAETDKAKAEFKDGLLQVRVPIPESKRQSRQIPIAS